MRLTLRLYICLVHIIFYAKARGEKYTIIAPGTIYSEAKFTIAVAVRQTSQPCQMKVGISGPSFSRSQQVEVSQDEVKNVEFDLPILEMGDYYLTADGINCSENFNNTTKLNYQKFDNHVRIQTDNGLYKPGDDINFRVLFLDKDLKPAVPDRDAVIWFEDAKRNMINEIKKFKAIKGVYTGKFKIPTSSVTGSWQLGVSNAGRFDEMVKFEVDEYELPKHVVQIEAPKLVSIKDGGMKVAVRSNYIFDEPLNGKTTVTFILRPESYFFSPNFKGAQKELAKFIKSSIMLRGKAEIEFNLKDLESLFPNKESSLYMSIIATVEDQSTGVKNTDRTFTAIYPFRYGTKCFSCPGKFEKDKEHDILVQMSYIDGSLLQNTKSTVALIYKKVTHKILAGYVETAEVVSFTGHMNKTGFVDFKVSLPGLPENKNGFSYFYSCEIKYLDEQREIYTTYQQRKVQRPETTTEDDKKSEEYLFLDNYVSDDVFYINKPAQLTLSSSQPLSYFDYVIIGRGNILKSGRVDLPDKPKDYILTLIPDFSWAPVITVYVNYIDENGKYHYTEQICLVTMELQNYIKITAPKRVNPGEEVALKIQTTPHSFVGLMAVDQSVLLRRHNNDLIPTSFIYGLRLPETSYPGTKSGCITLTNANYFNNRPKLHYRKGPVLRNIKDEIDVREDAADVGVETTDVGEDSLMPSTFSRGEGDAVNVREVTDSSETWLFYDNVDTVDAEFTVYKEIPKTLTSWVLTGFSMNPSMGLGITREPTKITTFLPFFISSNHLPYSVKRGEAINVPVFVFNYLDSSLYVTVTLDNTDDEYEFIDCDDKKNSERKIAKSIYVPAKGTNDISFLIKPKVVGNVVLKFTAISPVAGDSIHKYLKVIPEGITQYSDRFYFVNLKKASEFKSSLELPKNLVHVELRVMGDILGPVLNNLYHLVSSPWGYGTQFLNTFLPNYLVMKNFKRLELLSPNMEITLSNNLQSGYESIFKRRHPDGSFSILGPSTKNVRPRNGSTWLTTYVLRLLQQAKEFVNVNEKIIEEGLAYLSKQQAENGTFIEKDNDSETNYVTLTSAAVLALLENDAYAEIYSQELEKGLEYIAHNIDQSDSLYAKAMGTYTLNKGKHTAAKEKLSKLKLLTKTESDHMWWSAEEHKYGSGSDVEITSYALLALLDDQSTKVDDLVRIIKWLITQRDSYGGFGSTKSTEVGLAAIIKFAELTDYAAAKMSVEIKSDDQSETIQWTEENRPSYQYVELPNETKSVDLTAKGTGAALVQIAYRYNTLEDEDNPSFSIKTTIFDQSRPTHLEMSVCVNYVGEGESTNTALLQIYTPSGYVVDEEVLREINILKRVSNTKLKNSDSLLAVYFDHLYKDDETCLNIRAWRAHAVAMQKPAAIVLYDYYDNSKKSTSFYEIKSELCDIYETQERCNKCMP